MDTNIRPLEDVAQEHMQTVPTAILSAFVRGDLDLMLCVRAELAARGLGLHGEWIGFEEAMRLHLGLDPDCKSDAPPAPGLETLG